MGLKQVRVVVEPPDDVRQVLRRLEDEKALDANVAHRDRPRVPPRDFPDHTVLFGVRGQVGEALTEFLRTHQRPTVVEWQQVVE